MKNNFKKSTQKALTVLLAGAMLCTAGAVANATGASEFIGGITVNAAEDVKTEGYFEYKIVGDTVTVTHYNGEETNVVVPDTIEGLPVTTVGEYFIRDGNNLNRTVESVILPDSITKICDYAFYGCLNMKTVNIPDSVTEIGENAFCLCEKLESINIPDGITVIREETFSCCKSLEIVCIPETVTEIGERAFSSCEKLKTVNIPDTITEISKQAFRDCLQLNSITIPDSVTKIGYEAFKCCGFKEIQIPESVTYIDDRAFADSALESIDVPDTVKHMGKCVFQSSHLKSFTVPKCMTELQDGEFFYCRYLQEINIHENVTSIGNNAFEECYSIKSIVIPDSVTSIGDNVFKKCYALESVKLSDNIKTLGDYTFCECTALKDVKLPENLINTGTNTFYWCSSLETITIPYGTEVIGYHTFQRCYSLKNVIMPESLKEIEGFAFCECTSLEVIKIPYGVTAIRGGVFYSCDNISIIMVPGSVESEELFLYQPTNLVGSPKIIVYGSNDSPAFRYVKEHNISNIILRETINSHYLPLRCTSEITEKQVSVNSPVTINCSADGGEGGYTYAVYYRNENDTKWIRKQNFSTNDTVKIRPSKTGKYYFVVKVKDIKDNVVKKTYTVDVKAALENNSTISSSDIGLGNTLTINAKAKSGTGNYTYAVYYKNSESTKWIKKQDYSTNSEIVMKFGKAATYDICVNVKDSMNTISKKYFTVNVTKPENVSAISAKEINLGDTVTISGASVGISGDCQYSVLYKKADSAKWITRQAFSANNSVEFKPGAKTDYDLCVKIKDESGNIYKKFFSVTVK